jgi:hypothetical protein
MLQARSKSQCFLQYFERQTRAGFGSMTRFHVRNPFSSAQQTEAVLSRQPDRDATPELYAALDGPRRFRACARNDLREQQSRGNLLLDFVGVEYARTVLREAQVDGVELRRGVEDHGAHERG